MQIMAKNSQKKTRWRLNQAIWKISSSNWKQKILRVWTWKLKNVWNHHPENKFNKPTQALDPLTSPQWGFSIPLATWRDHLFWRSRPDGETEFSGRNPVYHQKNKTNKKKRVSSTITSMCDLKIHQKSCSKLKLALSFSFCFFVSNVVSKKTSTKNVKKSCLTADGTYTSTRCRGLGSDHWLGPKLIQPETNPWAFGRIREYW